MSVQERNLWDIHAIMLLSSNNFILCTTRQQELWLSWPTHQAVVVVICSVFSSGWFLVILKIFKLLINELYLLKFLKFGLMCVKVLVIKKPPCGGFCRLCLAISRSCLRRPACQKTQQPTQQWPQSMWERCCSTNLMLCLAHQGQRP